MIGPMMMSIGGIHTRTFQHNKWFFIKTLGVVCEVPRHMRMNSFICVEPTVGSRDSCAYTRIYVHLCKCVTIHDIHTTHVCLRKRCFDSE
jgi:hypothetical protein